MSVPSFIVVGAAKTGRSWLHRCLDEHPDVFVPYQVEIDFFSYHYEKGPEWYRHFFDGSDGAKAIGEKSPSYLVAPEVPERMCYYNARIKFVFVFRDPVARAYSSYCMLLKAGNVSENVNEVLEPGARVVNGSRYFEHLSRFLKVFERE